MGSPFSRFACCQPGTQEKRVETGKIVRVRVSLLRERLRAQKSWGSVRQQPILVIASRLLLLAVLRAEFARETMRPNYSLKRTAAGSAAMLSCAIAAAAA